MSVPAAPAVPRVEVAPGYSVARVIKGGWQLAGGHGPVDEAAALDGMRAFVESGVTTFDCADIYTGVEALIGRFLASRGGIGVQVHTKYVPDLATLGTVSADDVARAIDRSRERLGMARLDLVQFHWWDLRVHRAVEVARWLERLRSAGVIRHLGLTNFDTPTTAAILDAGVPVVTHQVQYSVLDQRPAGAMHDLCAAHGVHFLCYGTLAGGFLDERYLDAPPPEMPLVNRSQVKYRLVIDECGGWARFQALLHTLAAIARRHGVTIGAIAVAWVLEQPRVAAAIVGARDGRRLGDTLAALRVRLDDEDRRAIRQWMDQGPTMPGDVYALERDRTGRHGAIMKYGLNAAAGG
jgi:aryl-alcohol dehydrogenase-like predicted oxidoreductase